MTEEQIWASTPRKLFALLECLTEYNKKKFSDDSDDTTPGKAKEKVVDGYVDQLTW